MVRSLIGLFVNRGPNVLHERARSIQPFQNTLELALHFVRDLQWMDYGFQIGGDIYRETSGRSKGTNNRRCSCGILPPKPIGPFDVQFNFTEESSAKVALRRILEHSLPRANVRSRPRYQERKDGRLAQRIRRQRAERPCSCLPSCRVSMGKVHPRFSEARNIECAREERILR